MLSASSVPVKTAFTAPISPDAVMSVALMLLVVVISPVAVMSFTDVKSLPAVIGDKLLLVVSY